MRFTMLLVTVGFASVCPLAAQDNLPIAPGQRVRVSLDGQRRIAGVLKSQDGDSIRVQQYWNTAPLTIARSSISGVEVSTKRHSNAGTGAAVGLVVGSLLGAAAGAGCKGEFFCPGPAAGAASVGLLGAGLGALIGTFSHSETWASVYERRVRASFVAPTRGRGAGVGVTVAF